MVGQKNLRGVGGKHAFGGSYAKYNKINNNLKNFRGTRLLPEAPPPLSYGPVIFKVTEAGWRTEIVEKKRLSKLFAQTFMLMKVDAQINMNIINVGSI